MRRQLQEAENWLGQVIKIGDMVYKGHRSGNQSQFKVGRVLDIRASNVVGWGNAQYDLVEAKVDWLYYQGHQWYYDNSVNPPEPVDRKDVARKVHKDENSRPAWNDLESIVLIDFDPERMRQP